MHQEKRVTAIIVRILSRGLSLSLCTGCCAFLSPCSNVFDIVIRSWAYFENRSNEEKRVEESQCLENNNDKLSKDKFPFSWQVLRVVRVAMTKSSGIALVLAQIIGTKSCKAKPMPHFRTVLAVSFKYFPHVTYNRLRIIQ